ncbi:PREDICTED: serotriflin-like [Chinchilla lanigera]|uniref:serotriflin-like n=1 Tax=Chinchilla lanigera TaxID=34839 RepID=UPI00038ECC85|nr:PREDICTED: serotriflin-like [Chinchilla lanigera]
METWNSEVAKNAEIWARKCAFSHSPTHQRRISFAGCGENYFSSTAPKSWSHVIQTFYDEVKDFEFGLGDTRANAKTGHYTQLVWASSHQLGCAVAHCPHRKYKYFYVCHYCPAGNNKNTLKTPYKLGQPCGDCPGHCDSGLCTNPCMHVDNYSNCAALVKKEGCGAKITKDSCKATCKCPSEIK